MHKSLYAEFETAKKTVQKRKIPSEPESSTPKVSKQMKISDFKPVEKWNKNNATSRLVDDRILRFICLANEPFSVTEKPGFTDIFDVACPRFLNSFVKSNY
jgi:hypothetical protein